VTDVVELARQAPPDAVPRRFETAAPPDPVAPAELGVRASGREIATVVAWGLTTFGLLVICYGIYLVGITRLEHGRSQRALSEEYAHALSAKAAPIGGRIDEGTPVGTLAIPKFGVNEFVVEGTSGTQLKKGPGHFRASPLPGQAGNAVVACRRLTYGSPCYNLVDLKPGDQIRFVTGQGKSVYRVTEVRGVERGDSDVIQNTTANRLTLITSQRFVAGRRVAVIASLQSDVFRTPEGRPTEVRSSELGLNTEGGSVLAIVLWLQALLIACLASVWLLRRSSRPSVYLVMVPVILLLVLLVFDSITLLLPSTL
jgi:sortase A